MLSKLGIYFLLILLLMPFISISKLQAGELHYFTSGLSVIITSFTFANIIPSLRTYFQEDIAKLRRVILVGSLIPLICYLLCDGLIALQQSGRSTSGFVAQLSQVLNNVYITLLAKIFTSICLATSFLASMLSLSDFLADGFRVKKKGAGGILVYAATLIPPITIVLFSPGIFIKALGYAGVFCAILFILLPTLMAWRGRYHTTSSSIVPLLVKGGKPLLIFLGFTGLFFTGYGIKMALF
ncbi:aromatic amino acid transport family protein [Rickettsiella massiliensis]|uniref:aromatic amino acid transport family protein n=1 Tax=Rickettsiella massiliensis TaxID=676517 RepID=UPI00029B0852|nr:aromatic amino acid transport family protein [Rickettsiella massiliensis]